MNQSLDRIEGVKTFVPEMLIVPGIFAEGECHLLPAKRKQQLAFSRREVPHLIENVVGGQEHLGLQESHSAIFKQRSGIYHRLAAFRLGWGHEAANHRDAASFGRNVVDSFAVVLNKRGALYQVAGRITADREFGKKN